MFLQVARSDQSGCKFLGGDLPAGLKSFARILAQRILPMLFITDKPVSMNEWTEIHRADVEKVYARKSSNEDVEILSQSMEASQASCDEPKQQNFPPQVKGSRIRRHSSYEPNLDDILEEEDDGSVRERNRDLAEIHRERARNSGVLKRDREGRTWRKRHFVNNNYSRPRSYTA